MTEKTEMTHALIHKDRGRQDCCKKLITTRQTTPPSRE